MQAPTPPDVGGLSSTPDWMAPLIATIVISVIVGWLVMPIIKAWARRIEHQGLDLGAIEDIAHLRERVADLEASNVRVQELEERLDFAERMLAQRSDAPRLPMHRTPV